jgi:ketosteroid isomerase-like protein
MRSFVLVLVAFGLLLPGAFGQAARDISESRLQNTDSQGSEDQLRQFESMLLKAENENDAKVLTGILAADFRSLTPDGRLFNKSDALADAHKRSTMHFPYHVEHADLRVFQFGDAAVVTYSKEFIGTEGEVKGKVRKQGFIDVFSKDSSEWKLRFTKAEPERGESSE